MSELNDPLLHPLLSSDPAEAEAEIERLIVEVAQPLVAQILSRAGQTGAALQKMDADDLTATINLRLLDRLRRLPGRADEAIHDFRKYVATLTYNALNDHLRRHFPEQRRLKSRLRYTLTHDPRLALWMDAAGVAAGLREWTGAPLESLALPVDPEHATAAMRDHEHAGDALVEILSAAGRPVALEALMAFTARLWNVARAEEVDVDALSGTATETSERLEAREYLRALWSEIQQLRAPQRKALLLNLRDSGTVNVISILVRSGIAPFDDVAGALEMTPLELAAIWNDLPLGDLRIAEMLQVTRQQVINFRKSARERLQRRVGR